MTVHSVRSAAPIAPADSVGNGAVLRERPLNASRLAEDVGPHGDETVPDTLNCLEDKSVGIDTEEMVVKLFVVAEILRDVALVDGLFLKREIAVHLRRPLLRHKGDDLFDHELLDRHPESKRLVHFDYRDLGNDDAAVRVDLDEPLHLETLQRFPYRRSAHVQLGGQGVLGDDEGIGGSALEYQRPNCFVGLVFLLLPHGALPLETLSCIQAKYKLHTFDRIPFV